ncbi:helix-turn-helix transcriptional regulator [Planktotalea sp.]|uniref:helix-turn-helix domain-containing protein n=1 Tax=Planktotalea sp. TaxID=2029877 RepID=UPI00329A401D
MILVNSIGLITSGVCLFCAHLLLLRRLDTEVYLPLALLFLFEGLAIGFGVLVQIYDPDSTGHLFRASVIIGGLELASPFLFWAYVRALTTEGQAERIPKLRYHIAPILLVLAAFWSLLFLPSDFDASEYTDDDLRLIGIVLIAFVVVLADIVFKAMIATYVYLTIRRLIAYRTRLRDVFASTENRELTWIWVIIVCIVIYLSASIAFTASVLLGVFAENSYEDHLQVFDATALLFMFWIIGVWGLRQRPGLTRQPVITPEQPDASAARKYEKSALDAERLERIAAKVETAMSQDLLYRDPNLSLWDLSKRIGVTGHYVSQALNMHLNKSFFDVVNGWRIKDAVKQLNTSDETILVIAYDVGFNSRSAFYKAFKRETGKTPSDLRK